MYGYSNVPFFWPLVFASQYAAFVYRGIELFILTKESVLVYTTSSYPDNQHSVAFLFLVNPEFETIIY